MEGDRLAHFLYRILGRVAKRDASGQVRRPCAEAAVRCRLNQDHVRPRVTHWSLPDQSSLLENAPLQAHRQVTTRLARDRDPTRLGRMPELPVAASLRDEVP